MIILPPIAEAQTPEAQLINGPGFVSELGNLFTIRRGENHPLWPAMDEPALDPAPEFEYMIAFKTATEPPPGARLMTLKFENEAQLCSFNNRAATATEHGLNDYRFEVAQSDLAGGFYSVLLIKRLSDLHEIELDAGEFDWFVFTRVATLMHPTPKFKAHLDFDRRSTKTIEGKREISRISPDPLLKLTLELRGYDETAMNEALVLRGYRAFTIWGAGLEKSFYETPNRLLAEWRRAGFTRTMVVTKSSGLIGVEGLDIAALNLDLSMEETNPPQIFEEVSSEPAPLEEPQPIPVGPPPDENENA